LDKIPKVHLSDGCNSEFEDECLRNQIIYRASLAMLLFFIVLAFLASFSEVAHTGHWPLKFIISFAITIGFLWGENSAFSAYSEVARVLSLVWMLFQGLLIVDFAHDYHDYLMEKSDSLEQTDPTTSKYIKFFYLFLSVTFQVLPFLGIVYLFNDYGSCPIGKFFISVTLIMGVSTTFISVTEKVLQGFLTPSILFAYSTYLCWYALMSSSSTSCNPTALSTSGTKIIVSEAVVMGLGLLTLVWCTWHGTKILQIFLPNGESVLTSSGFDPNLRRVLTGGSNDQSNDTEAARSSDHEAAQPKVDPPAERIFFHFLLAIFAIFCAMGLTNWQHPNGEPMGLGSERVAQESMWMKIVSQWLMLILYSRILYVAYLDKAE